MIATMEATPEMASSLGLTNDEFEKIKNILQRTPNYTELSIYSVMWSEHCSYKNSIKYLKTLPREGKGLLVEAGEENAGLVDIGDGLACAFKIESHNHPSAIEPYQGAATGVGGIHRDIFTMGARPIAAMNSLRFGIPDTAHMKNLVRGVVRGIGNYGNSFGVPTVGGETYFMECYQQNILVNAMSVGIVKVGETISATAHGAGNPVFIVGSSTGKDGIHGATFASADLTEDSADDLPSVQVGDPFQEKLLLEATLEVIQTGCVVGMQDMGAAGITCSTSEMSAKGKSGMIIHLDKVPLRQQEMEPYEILLSESQERMLVVCKKGEESKVLQIFDKWDLECAQIGEVTDDTDLEYYFHGSLVAKIPAESLVLGGGAPVYNRSFQTPAYFAKIKEFKLDQVEEPTDLGAVAMKLITSLNLASKKWIYQQYDSTVRTGSMNTNQPSDASLVWVKGTEKALAMTVDCNSAYVYADPNVGAQIAVAEAARNIVCSGGEPLAITNCLNFGNPYDQEVYFQFVEVIKGMGIACRAFNTPVTGGNVSFYNQSQTGGQTIPIYPTPTIGMIGLLPIHQKTFISFTQPGLILYLLGPITDNLSSSEYLRSVQGIFHSPVPYFDLKKELKVQEAVKQLIRNGLIAAAHDISDGGLLVSLFESCMKNELGVKIISKPGIRKDSFLFGEGQSRVVVAILPEKENAFQKIVGQHPIEFMRLGTTTMSGDFEIDNLTIGNMNLWIKDYTDRLSDIMES
ncbi:MAG: phosphoribosylformylglycinamidine synthase subunit PurL [Saprospiraceae bacterium]